LWRDPEGRGSFFGGALDGPQIAAIVMVLAGAIMLRERPRSRLTLPQPREQAAQNEADHA
jgi:hypothetical protein